MAKTYTPAELAAECNTTPKQIRRFMRSQVRADGGVIGKDTPGKGKRYALDARTFNAYKRAFIKAQSAGASADESVESAEQSAEA